jgi:hypothetical protein
MKFSAILSALGFAPKTLPQATATLETAAATFAQVDTLFTSAGLNLETMLAAGPDALKAHLDGLSAKDGELAAAQAKVKELEGKVTTITAESSAANAKFSTVTTALASVGITAATKPEEFSAALDAHVKQAAAIELSKTGHKPVADVPPPPPGKTQTIDPTLTGLARVEAHFKAQASAKSAGK